MSSLLTSALIIPVEHLLNSLLQQDCAALTKLQKIFTQYSTENRPPAVAIQCSSPPRWQVYVLLHSQQLELRAVYDEPLAAQISATASAYARLLRADDARTAVFNPDIQLSGDTHLVQALHEIFQSLDFDWEYYFSFLAGDVLTHQLSRGLDTMRDWSAGAATAMRMNLQEYLQEESRLLPQRAEVEAFYHDVAELRLRLDRLQARLQHL